MTARIVLNPGRDKSLIRKHPWVFSRAIKEIQGKPERGETVEVVNNKNNFLCLAAYSPDSQITARAWSFNAKDTIDADFFEQKITKALKTRLDIIADESDAYRLIAAESDGLPGVTIDYYAGTIVAQFLSAGAEFHKANIVTALLNVFPNAPIFERSDVDVRKKEGLHPIKGWLANPQESTKVVITEHGLKIELDIEQGHKTGFYLDQRDSRYATRKYCQGKTVLNCFSYTGAFSLYAKQAGAKSITNVDISANAIALARQNHTLNGFDEKETEFVKADVFKLLRQYKEEGRKFDTIILDPPKFVENKHQLKGACRGYKDINMLAFQLLNEGGTLLSFSCSGLMEESLFQKIIADAALDANRNGIFIEKLGQAKDHPIGLAYPEGYYLKGFVVRA
ncbi:class I SAM-dependent rRNA methyltransferase [Algibacillus agarilyticus]|uniref:class I SAM-dependent rRNA methyltransferase n=1 Tax=Algibacillus agarilyticus TaxID=2234133 RepID=UPI000DCF972B|nr:class I SAM-dependent methyltransferase [Algibacillus agarilyticus]